MLISSIVQAVDGGSATVHGKFEQHVSLDDTTHISMCKFDNRDNLNYQRLLMRIIAEISEEPSAIRRAGTGSSTNSQRLRRQDTLKQLQGIRDSIGKSDTRSGMIQAGMSS